MPTHCSHCGQPLGEVWVQHGYHLIDGGPNYERHLRCPSKVTSTWQALLRGDFHDEFIDPGEFVPSGPGDPGPLVSEVKWR